jgi:hypothetical protein
MTEKNNKSKYSNWTPDRFAAYAREIRFGQMVAVAEDAIRTNNFETHDRMPDHLKWATKNAYMLQNLSQKEALDIADGLGGKNHPDPTI